MQGRKVVVACSVDAFVLQSRTPVHKPLLLAQPWLDGWLHLWNLLVGTTPECQQLLLPWLLCKLQCFTAQPSLHTSSFCSHTAFRALLNHVPSDGKMHVLLLFAWHCAACCSATVSCPMLSWGAGGRELWWLTQLKHSEMHQKDLLQWWNLVCYSNLNLQSHTSISLDQSVRYKSAYLQVYVCLLGLVFRPEPIHKLGEHRDIQPRPSRQTPRSPNQCSRGKGSWRAVAPGYKCGDVSGLGYFRNQVSRSDDECSLSVHFSICWFSSGFSDRSCSASECLKIIQHSGFVFSFLFRSLNSISWICFSVTVPKQNTLWEEAGPF